MIDPLNTLKEYLKFASVSADPQYAEGVKGACNFVCDQLKGIGFYIDCVDTPGNPVILATYGDNPDWPHIMIYAHYDVQPADPLELWHSKPFSPEVRDGRLYARGSADNKGPFVIQLTALANVFEKHPDLPLRITFLIEGEEEIGSPSFPWFLEKYKDRFKEAELILVSDTSSPDPDQVVITTSLRGILGLEIKLTGPQMDLHSGLHGGPLLNPLQALMEICASLHTHDGRVNVPGFYDDVLDPEDWERQELKRYPLTEAEYQEFLGVPAFHPPKGFGPLESSRFAPTLEFNGIGGGYQGEGGKTIIPSKAFAKITCRLVPNQDSHKIRDIVNKTIQERCPSAVHIECIQESGGEPYFVIPPHHANTSKDMPTILAKAFEAADVAIEKAFGKKPLYLREGASIPIIGQIKTVTGLDSVIIGLTTKDDNFHAPNESFHLGMMEKGIKVYESILKEMAGL